MAMFGYSGDAPPPNDNEVDDDDMEDFYGDDSRETVDAQPGVGHCDILWREQTDFEHCNRHWRAPDT